MLSSERLAPFCAVTSSSHTRARAGRHGHLDRLHPEEGLKKDGSDRKLGAEDVKRQQAGQHFT